MFCCCCKTKNRTGATTPLEPSSKTPPTDYGSTAEKTTQAAKKAIPSTVGNINKEALKKILKQQSPESKARFPQ